VQENDRRRVGWPRRREVNDVQPAAGHRHEVTGRPMRALDMRNPDGRDRGADDEDCNDAEENGEKHQTLTEASCPTQPGHPYARVAREARAVARSDGDYWIARLPRCLRAQ
jgi:hypothetical protein